MWEAYFQRIGYSGRLSPDLETLNAIIAAHVQTIPFENLDVLLGRPMSLEPEALLQKLVHDKRGGYCFEQNGLLLEVLRTIGFDVVPLAARVRWQRPRESIPPRTHLFLQVSIGRVPWLVDVGVGGLSPSSALRMDVSGPQPTLHETRRIVGESNATFHQVLLADEWHDVCEWFGEPMPLADREVAHWYTSTSPTSHFRNRLIVARAGANGARHTILNREYTERDALGRASKHEVTSPDDLLRLLDDVFGMRFPAGTQFPCESLAWP